MDGAIPTLDAGGGSRFRLFENGGRGVQPVSAGKLQQLREAALEGQSIVLTGPLYGESDGIPGLVVEGIHLANGGSRP